MKVGRWMNFDELESNLSLDELLAAARAIQDSEHENRKFAAALKGIDLDNENGNVEDRPLTFEDIQRKAMGDDPITNDIVNLRGQQAADVGFGIGQGLGFEEF